MGLDPFEDVLQETFLAQADAVRRRLEEVGGSLEVGAFSIPVYDFSRIADTIAREGPPGLRELLANIHAGMARVLYSEQNQRDEARVDALLAYRYGASALAGWPTLQGDVGYMLLTGRNLEGATEMFHRALQSNDGNDQATATTRFNLAVALAQSGDLDRSLEQLELASELAQNLEEEDRSMLCLVVGRTIGNRLTFAEEEGPDLAVAIAVTRDAVVEARGRVSGQSGPTLLSPSPRASPSPSRGATPEFDG